MKTLIAFALFTLACAKPLESPLENRPLARALSTPQQVVPVAVVQSSRGLKNARSFSYGSERADGTKVSESGNLYRGSYSYKSPKGVLITTNWVADENRFQAPGDHLPTPPPMPDHFVKLLAGLRAADARKDFVSYSYTYPDGDTIKVDWIANRLSPTGDHLPIPPPMPEH